VDGCLVVFLVVVVVAAAAAILQNREKERARRAYLHSLARLKLDPANPDLREETLRLGRSYSNLTRNRRGVTIFDEVALSNDISAACAGAFRQPKQLAEPRPQATIEARLAQLAELRTKGLLEEEEYRERRREILRDV
jgi:hypothetical protein